MRNIKLILSYDGTCYLGWQKTHAGASIEETLQKALEQILQHPISLQAASRTDAGVHALGQVVNFFTSHPMLSLPKLQNSLNALLPKDISVSSIEEVPIAFHPTLDNCGKRYHYFLCNSFYQLPFHRLYSWHYRHFLDIQAMKQASQLLLGTHDFSSFCNERDQFTRNPLCTLDEITIQETADKRLLFSIQGDRFLYKMVRNLVGTLVYVGAHKLHVHEIPSILKSKTRALAGMTAPSHGLFLHEVFYPVSGSDCAFKAKSHPIDPVTYHLSKFC